MDFNVYNGKKYHEIVDDFINFIETTNEIYYRDKDVDEEMLRMQNNLLHDLEFNKLNYHGIAKIGKEIKTLRNHRREYKNEYLLVEPIKNFYKGNLSVIDELKEVSKKLKENELWLSNQFYNQRGIVDNLIDMEKDNRDEDNVIKEDLISLKRVLNKYSSIIDIKVDKDTKKITATLQLEGTYGINRSKEYILSLGENIEKFYKPRLNNIICTTSTSDMMLKDNSGRKTLTGIIEIFLPEGEKLYELHITIRGGKEDFSENKKSKKGKKKKK